MTIQENIDFERIERAIQFIDQHFKDQPSLEEIAKAVHVSPFHFQRMFTQWAGISPKKFVQYRSLGYVKGLLTKRTPLVEAAHETGLSGPGRLHDLFVTIEGMTPGEFKSGGAGLTIRYRFAESPFGKVIVASTPKGVCHLHFYDGEADSLSLLQLRFPNASLRPGPDQFQQDALSIFRKDWEDLGQIKLHLAGTAFQLKVWESLLSIPMGMLSTYGEIAGKIGQPNASRAVGAAIGRNPVAFLIPCHRVIQCSGKPGGYRWGADRKSSMIGWEASNEEQNIVARASSR